MSLYTTVSIWVVIVQFAFICGVEAVFVSVFTGTHQFDTQYGHPSPGILGLMTALYPIFAGIGSFSTLLLGSWFSSKTILQIASFIWLAGFLIGALYLRLDGILVARAVKGLAIGLITSTIAPYTESIGHLVDAPKVLTAFQGIVPFALMCTSIISFLLHHYQHRVDFNICWLIAASPALTIAFTSALIPTQKAARPASIKHQLKSMRANPDYFKILKACLVQVGVQLTGVNVVLYYTSSLCLMIGVDSQNSKYVSMGIYGCNFAATIASVAIVSRLPLLSALKFSSLGMAVCHGAMFVLCRLCQVEVEGTGLACIVMCFVFMTVYSMFFNGISFVYTSQLVPEANKTVGVGLAIGIGWLTNALLSAVVPLVMSRLRGTTFILFCWFCCTLYVVL